MIRKYEQKHYQFVEKLENMFYHFENLYQNTNSQNDKTYEIK